MDVSVIIPTFNRAHFLGEAIESVLNQTYKSIEIIVIDDGSTDNTKTIIEQYLDRVKYFYIQHAGISHARNEGLKRATGEFISFLDSDDLFYSYKIELQVQILQQYRSIGLVCSEASAFDDNGFWEEFHLKSYHSPAYRRSDRRYEHIYSESVSLKDLGPAFEKFSDRKLYMGNIYDFYLQSLIVFTNTILFRKEIIHTVGLQNENYRLFEEFDFFLRCTKHFKVAFLDIPTYKLRYHRDQISNTHHSDGLAITIEKQQNLLQIVQEHAFSDDQYYAQHKAEIGKRLAALHKALAIPMMVSKNPITSARFHIKQCANYGKRPLLLWLITFLPRYIRKIAIKLMSNDSANKLKLFPDLLKKFFIRKR
jgi:glycosyltransferase involved in cell wall biosynthesis